MSERDEALFLGYDASCMDCSNIARSIRREAGDHLSVVSLRAGRMWAWREQALGRNAPWAPTLVRITNERVDAWTGWQIAPVLAKHLDTGTTWRILGALGGNALGNGRTKNSPINRSSFLRATVGSFLGLGLLMKAGPAAADSGPRPSMGDADEQDVEQLRGDELIEAAQRGLGTDDLTNVTESRSLVADDTHLPDSLTELTSVLREADEATGQQAPPGREMEAYGVRIDRGGGITETGVLFYQHEQGTLIHLRMFDEPVDGLRTRAHRMHVEHGTTDEHPILTTVAHSVNGAVPTSLEPGDLSTLSSDPCGGCNLECGPANTCGEEHLTSQCDWEATWQCVVGLGGCALCAGCSGWFMCIGCAMTACPTAVDSCCSSAEEVCARCAYPT